MTINFNKFHYRWMYIWKHWIGYVEYVVVALPNTEFPIWLLTIKSLFSTDVSTDHPDVRPQSFCDRCYAVINRKVNANRQNKVYLHSIEVFQWFPHDDSCMTCNTYGTLKKGGRTKKSRKNRGAPLSNSCHQVMQHIGSIAMPKFYEHGECITVNSSQPVSMPPSDYMCFICENILNSPLKLSCGSLTCAYCLLHCWTLPDLPDAHPVMFTMM